MFWSEPLLAIESSCDETSAAVVAGRKVLSSVVSSQADLHAKWGGVVPEAAARAHVEAILPVIQEALTTAGLERPRAIAVTNRPGLVGSLSVGATAAKTLAAAWNIPIVGIHHLEGHLLSVCADLKGEPMPRFPLLGLVVSGGHTELVEVASPGEYRILAETRDDAAGEAFDKGARLLGLGYPGGKALEDAAVGGNPRRYRLPRGVVKDPNSFSFSGLKTAMLRLVESEGESLSRADAAASLQAAIVDALTVKTLGLLDGLEGHGLALVGGVAANKALRESLQNGCHRMGRAFHTPDFSLCTDNAAMIGIAGSFRLAKGERAGLDLDVSASGELP